jgi:RimJ/RimL family protein N-acetyltransferase
MLSLLEVTPDNYQIFKKTNLDWDISESYEEYRSMWPDFREWIILKNKKHIGVLLLHQFETKNNKISCEVGIYLKKRWRRKGYAQESLVYLEERARELSIHTLNWSTPEINIASNKSAIKCEFKFKKSFIKEDETWNMYSKRILKC